MTENQLQRHVHDAKSLVEVVMAFAVTTHQQCEHAATVLVQVARQRKKVEAFTRPNIKRLHAVHKAAINEEKKIISPLKNAETHLKRQIAKYEGEQRRIREEERKKLMAEDKVIEALIVADDKPEMEGISIRTTHKAEVLDLHALVKAAAKDPTLLRFLLPNQVAINKFARAMEGEVALPGIRFYKHETTAVRT